MGAQIAQMNDVTPRGFFVKSVTAQSSVTKKKEFFRSASVHICAPHLCYL